MKKLLALAAAVLCLAQPTLAQETLAGETVIEGRLVGQDGRPMKKAHVKVVPPDRASEPVASAEVGADGRFTLSLDTTGAFRIAFLGVHHDRVVRPLFVETPGPLQLDVQLAPYRRAEDFSGLRITGDFDDFIRNLSRPLLEQPGGSYAATVEAPGDSVAYQVLGAVAGQRGRRGTAGTQADAYRYGGHAAYRSVIAAPGDSVRIVFDPSELPSGGGPAVVRVRNANALARATEALFWTSSLNARLARKTSRVQEKFRKQAQAGVLADPQAAFEKTKAQIDSIRASFDVSGAMERLDERLAATTDPAMRRVLLAAYFGLPDVGQEKDPALARQALAEVPSASGLWALQGGTLAQVLGALPDTSSVDSAAARAYTDAIVRASLHASVRGEVLFRRLQQARAVHDVERARVLYDRIQQEAGGTAAVVQAGVLMRKMAREERRRHQRIRAGRPVPRFKLAAFDDSTKTYSRESLRGQTYLIDFWAVWCGPCVREMPNLRRVYDKYKDRGFSILSVSLDDRPGDVRTFREERHAMPWKHAFLGEDVRAAITRRFEVASIPKPILVGKDGEILATEKDLRGGNLMKTLAEVFDEEDEAEPSGR